MINISDDMKHKVTEGDIVTIHQSNWNCTKRIGEPYKAIVLWLGINNQPLITKIGEYEPRWSSYGDIIEINNHVNLHRLIKDKINSLEEQENE